jgi:hypothetical protein
MKKEVLSPNDWNFDNVPDNELVACCYWEYARESAFLLDLKKRFDAWDGSGRCPELLAVGINQIEHAPPQVYLRLREILVHKLFPSSWQSLSESQHLALIEIDFGTPPAFRCSASVTETEFLLEEAHKRVREFNAAEEKLHHEYPGLGGETLRRMGKWPKYNNRCSVMWDDGTEATIVQIAWEHYTNEQIIKGFRHWIKTSRPKDLPQPSKQGHKHISQRVALERLGILRLLHHYGLAELPKQNSGAWKLYNAVNRRWRKDAQKADLEFGRLFPFLKSEHPLSWPTKD